jgi:hypothetical protein
VGIYYHIHLLDVSGRYTLFLCYIFASAVAWILERVIRLVRVINNNVGMRGGTVGRASLLLSAGILKIVIRPRGIGSKQLARLQPGHHLLLWVPSAQLLGSHPFSVAEVIRGRSSQDGVSLVIYAKVRQGLTKRLASRASQYPQGCEMVMYIEGFYGHYEDVSARVCACAEDANLTSSS